MIKEPNFLIGGAGTAGTSFLSSILMQKPEVYLPKNMRPEPHFFYKSWEFKKGKNYYLNKWFKNVPKDKIAIGERSSSYLFGSEEVANKIYSYYPKMKFVFVLRNPYERAWANYRFTALNGLENLSFIESIKVEYSRLKKLNRKWSEIKPYSYVGRSLYGAQLKSYFAKFKDEQILTIKSENLSLNTSKELKSIFKFLNVPYNNFKYENAKDFTSLSIIDPKIQFELRKYFGLKFDKIIESLRKNQNLKKYIKNDIDQTKIDILKKNLKTSKDKLPLKSIEVLRNYFEEDLKLVKNYVNFNINDWNL